MRLSVILGVCIVMCGAMVAQAELVDVVSPDGLTTYPGVLSYTRTAVNGTVDQIVITLNNLQAMAGAAQTKLQVFEGQFISTGTLYSAPTTGFDPNDEASSGVNPVWKAYASKNDGNAFAQPNHYSWVNINYTDSAGVNWSHSAASMYGSWSGSGIANAIKLATLFVGTGDGVTFAGSWTNQTVANGGWGFDHSINMGGHFTIPGIPEPSTLLLAASGLIGLLCYAWRKRR